jgi:hypothetical protein
LKSLIAPRRKKRELICPSCQFAAGALPCDDGQIKGSFPRVPYLKRGALRDRHERRVRDAMDASVAKDERIKSGRRSRVVPISRR